MIYAIILAGGRGSRFWPLSRYRAPKQFLNLCTEQPLLIATLKRVYPLIGKENIYIATNKIYHKNIQACLKKFTVPSCNILFEPQGKNTFAPISLLTKRIYSFDKEAVILAMPSDHYINQVERFLRALSKGIKVAQQGYIVTLGIRPNRPETGFGYIKVKARVKSKKGKVYRVEKFIEKPVLAKAERFIKDRRYFWNGGIFIFRADILLGEVRKFLPQDFKLINKITSSASLNKLWPRLPATSIDYAIMEKSRRIVMVAADFNWQDLGSWQALESFWKKDKSGNILKGNCVDIGSRNLFAFSDNRLLATLGLDNLIIVNTKDALLVCAKDRAQDVKRIVQLLKQKKLAQQI